MSHRPTLTARLNYFLIALGLYLGTPETAHATTTEPEAPLTTEDKIRAAFPERPETMVAIARCESNLRQFEADGVTPLKGRLSSDYGLFQINYVHLPETEKLGIDVMTEDGNIAFARVLYDRNGTRDWVCAHKLGLV